MAYLMSDVAAGSDAALRLQQNMAIAPDVQKLESMAVQQKQADLEKAKLANLVADAGFQSSKESKQKLQALAQDPKFKSADDANKLRMAAMVEAESGNVENLTKNLQAAELIEAKDIANNQKKLDLASQEIGKTLAVLKSVSLDKVEEQFKNLPQESQNALIKEIGPENWKRMTPEEKVKATEGLMYNAKGQLAIQLKTIELEKTRLNNESKERIANINAAWHLQVKMAGADARDMRDWKIYENTREAIEKSGRKTLERLDENVEKAQAALDRTTFFKGAETAAYEKAVKERDAFKRSQTQKELDLVTTTPPFPGKSAVIENLKKQLELYPEPDAPKGEDKPAAPKQEAPKVEDKKAVTSNKSKELKPAPQDVLDKANEAVKNGADIDEVLKRLYANGYSVRVVKKEK